MLKKRELWVSIIYFFCWSYYHFNPHKIIKLNLISSIKELNKNSFLIYRFFFEGTLAIAMNIYNY